MPACSGNEADHCCYFGQVCEHLEEYTVAGRHWACGLLRRYGSWDDVYQSPEWPAVLSNAIAHGLPETYRCGDWPPPGQTCVICGVSGG